MMNMSLRTFAVIILLALPAWSAPNPRDELSGVRRDIKAQQQLITKTRNVESAVSTELQGILKSLKEKESELGKLASERNSVESGLGRTGTEIVTISKEADSKRQEIDTRLSSLYKAGEFGALRMFFSSESFPQLAENIRYMKSVLNNDRQLYGEYRQKIEQLTVLKISLEKDAQRKERIITGIAKKKKEIEVEKSRKATYLGKVRQDRKSYEASLKDLQANANRLQSMVSRLEALSRKKLAQAQRHEKTAIKPSTKPVIKPGIKTPPPVESAPVPERGFASLKGRLSLPVRGEIVESYGKHKHPEFNSFTFSKGLSIAAAAGTDIKAIYEGNVIFADYFKGFGNMIIVDHGGGYFSLYAHASRLSKKVGANVARNESIGAVGDVDSSKGSMLYFEIRHQGKPVDPSGWVH